MKNLKLSLFTTLILIIAVHAAKAQPEPIDFTPLSNYVIKNTVKFTGGLNCFVCTNLTQFNKIFAAAKTGGSKPPHFGNDRVIGIAMPPSARETTVIIQKVEVAGSTTNVHCIVNYGGNLNYKATPIVVGTIPRDSFTKTIAFYRDGRMYKAFTVK
jgi:hypothetical protein